eukprot:4297296-Pleurochrysis_carterae.AAC.5
MSSRRMATSSACVHGRRVREQEKHSAPRGPQQSSLARPVAANCSTAAAERSLFSLKRVCASVHACACARAQKQQLVADKGHPYRPPPSSPLPFRPLPHVFQSTTLILQPLPALRSCRADSISSDHLAADASRLPSWKAISSNCVLRSASRTLDCRGI